MRNALPWLQLAVSGGVFAIAKLLVAALPDAAFAQVFCKVPAWVATAYFQASLSGETLLLATGRAVSVSRACGGADFFATLCAMLAWRATEAVGTSVNTVPSPDSTGSCAWRDLLGRLRWLPGLCAGAWGVTLFVNVMRVIAAVWGRALVELWLPERMEAAVHLTTTIDKVNQVTLKASCHCVLNFSGNRLASLRTPDGVTLTISRTSNGILQLNLPTPEQEQRITPFHALPTRSV